MSDRGLFAQDFRVKITNTPRQAGKLVIIPAQMGFKNQDKWANEWVEIVIFPQLSAYQEWGLRAEKGQSITVSGRMTMEEYQEKKRWKIYANNIAEFNHQDRQPSDIPDIPF